MHLLKPKLNEIDDNGPGVVRLHSGKLMDLNNPTPDDINIDDIAWSLGKLIRYNGHIPYDYTVARHSVIMSYYVGESHSMEALLHDAGEAYCGDIIQPLKRVFPQLEKFEDNITGVIMTKYNKGKQVFGRDADDHQYQKSEWVSVADVKIYQHECYRFGRPGKYCADMHNAELEAIRDVGLGSLYQTGMAGDREAFLARFYQLLAFESDREQFLSKLERYTEMMDRRNIS